MAFSLEASDYYQTTQRLAHVSRGGSESKVTHINTYHAVNVSVSGHCCLF